MSVSEIRLVYANMSRPSCTLLQGVENGTGIVAMSGKCQDWIFKREHGYESLTTEVSLGNPKELYLVFSTVFFRSSNGSVISRITRLWGNHFSFLALSWEP